MPKRDKKVENIKINRVKLRLVELSRFNKILTGMYLGGRWRRPYGILIAGI